MKTSYLTKIKTSQITRSEIHIVPILENRIRFQEYGIAVFSTITTKSALKKAIKKGSITINAEEASTATYIQGGEKIVFTPFISETKEKTLDFNLKVVFEDDFLAIIEKPAGIIVSGNKFKSIVNALPTNLKPSTQDDALLAPQPAHRLDFATSGLLVVGKTKGALLGLNALFKNKEIDKTYHAVTIGRMTQKEGMIAAPIDAKTSKSEYKILATEISERFQYLNLVQLVPKTGRRHQLRKHMLFIGNPILGDATYCEPEQLLKGKGLYLHASNISFLHPITQKEIAASLPLPKKFRKIFKAYLEEK